jgi:acetylornithine deacetylase/succinyl-diaminopimelate desuccinylase-like protein
MSHALAETARHLQALLRLNTTNPPGQEILAAAYLAHALKAEGIEPLVLESAPGRGNVIARLTGAGEAPPLLLYSHTDVVPAEPEHWKYPPFAGEIAEGCVWGRGAVDMKNTVAQQLMVMLMLKRNGVALKRDVIFAATADEEIGGRNGFGMAWLARHHPELLQAEFGLTEVGGYNTDFAGQNVYLIQVAEKGTCWFKLRAYGEPGHGSQPHAQHAVAQLILALAGLVQNGLPYHLSPAAAGFLRVAAEATAGTPLNAVLSQLADPAVAPKVLKTLKGQPLYRPLYAMLHNTATPTGLKAGAKTNVIPSVAEATIDGRFLPGFDPEAFFAEMRAAIGDDLNDGLETEMEIVAPPLEVPHDTALFRLMAATIQKHDPTANAVLPYMMSGATDAKYLAPLGVPTYGFAPLQLPPGMPYMEMFHAHNERVPLAGLAWGVNVLYDVVTQYCA